MLGLDLNQTFGTQEDEDEEEFGDDLGDAPATSDDGAGADVDADQSNAVYSNLNAYPGAEAYGEEAGGEGEEAVGGEGEEDGEPEGEGYGGAEGGGDGYQEEVLGSENGDMDQHQASQSSSSGGGSASSSSEDDSFSSADSAAGEHGGVGDALQGQHQHHQQRGQRQQPQGLQAEGQQVPLVQLDTFGSVSDEDEDEDDGAGGGQGGRDGCGGGEGDGQMQAGGDGGVAADGEDGGDGGGHSGSDSSDYNEVQEDEQGADGDGADSTAAGGTASFRAAGSGARPGGAVSSSGRKLPKLRQSYAAAGTRGGTSGSSVGPGVGGSGRLGRPGISSGGGGKDVAATGGGGAAGAGGTALLVDDVARHYSQRDNKRRDVREASPIIHLKKLNNWIKSVLIRMHARPCDRVLDLACGKGGDLIKWEKAKIGFYVGVDVASGSIYDAAARYNGDSIAGNTGGDDAGGGGAGRGGGGGSGRVLGFPAVLACCDCFAVALDTELAEYAPFDLCSCQFALHYSFENEARARQALNNVSQLLAPGGLFIGTLPDANVIVQKLRAAPGLEFGNAVFKIKFDPAFASKTFLQSRGPFGIRYDFYLEDAVDCPEWLVPFPALVALAEEYGLELVMKMNFHSFIQQQLAEHLHASLMRHIVGAAWHRSISPDEWDAAYLYCVFVFRKTGERDENSAEKRKRDMVSAKRIESDDILFL